MALVHIMTVYSFLSLLRSDYYNRPDYPNLLRKILREVNKIPFVMKQSPMRIQILMFRKISTILVYAKMLSNRIAID